MHGALPNHMHSFIPAVGLIIHEDSHDKETTALLCCVAEHHGISYTLQVCGYLP